MRVLSAKYPTFQLAAAEMINLDSILRLPKGTEHFLSDVHGEYEAFCHIMNNCSGVIREKIEALYGKVMTKSERDEFATLIYYPAAIIAEMKAKGVAELKEWYAVQAFGSVQDGRLQIYAKQGAKILAPQFRLYHRRTHQYGPHRL